MDGNTMYSKEAVEYMWKAAIPLQIHLHESEVTTFPAPPPAFVLGARIGYLPLLMPVLKPYFSNVLPPGDDAIWFDYKGLPLKWHIPTGVLFDLLCAEPERPWNLTVHFRGYPSGLLTPCDDEDTVRRSFINSLKEAAYTINGNCKNIMNMSEADQLDLWQSVLKGQMEGYLRVSSSRLKLGPFGEDCMLKKTPNNHPQSSTSETTSIISNQTGKIPVRLYVRYAKEDFDDLDEMTPVISWDNISYINRPVEIHFEEGKYFTLRTAIESLLPEYDIQTFITKADDHPESASASTAVTFEQDASKCSKFKSKIRLIRIHGIEPALDIPLSWVFNNLSNPDYFLHISIVVLLENKTIRHQHQILTS